MAGHYFFKQYLVYFCNHLTEIERASCFTLIIEPGHKISNNVVCTTSKGSDRPVHMGSLIRTFASHLNIL